MLKREALESSAHNKRDFHLDAEIMTWLQASRPGDLLSAAFILGFICLVLAYRYRLAAWRSLLGIYFLLFTLQMALPITAGLGITPDLVTGFFPVVPIVVIFSTLGFIPEVNSRDQDEALCRIDRKVFGVDLSVWLERFAWPWLTEVMQLAYLAYYILPFILLGVLYERGKEQAFQLSATALILSHYLAFIGYVIAPALGPRFALVQQYRRELKGFLIAEPIRDFLNYLEGIKRDAFPSGHTSAILITAFYILRFTPELASWSIPIAGLMIVSTIYLRYHYVVDVAAGVLLAAFCLLLAPFLQ